MSKKESVSLKHVVQYANNGVIVGDMETDEIDVYEFDEKADTFEQKFAKPIQNIGGSIIGTLDMFHEKSQQQNGATYIVEITIIKI